MSISVSHLHKSYGPVKAVSDLSFEIRSGEVVGFLGPNGAGKSTTLKMITGFLTPDAGTIVVHGEPVVPGKASLRRHIGYLPESNPLYQDLYVTEFLRFMAGLHGLHDTSLRIREVMEQVGLGPMVQKKIQALSKGYRQRVGLAAALIHNPGVLILDEPTTGLDPNQIIEIRELIRRLGQTKTILFSSHILQEVEALCERVVIIHQGQRVADDTLSALSQQLTQQAVRVRLANPPELNTFRRLTGLDTMEQFDAHTFRIPAANPERVKKIILEACLQHGLDLISLDQDATGLEAVFHSLTQPSSNNP